MGNEDKQMLIEGIAEQMVLSTYADAKNILIFGVDLEGSVDTEAVSLSVSKTVEQFPCFVSSAGLSGRAGGRRLVWMPHPESTPELNLSELGVAGSSDSFEEALLARLDDSLNKDWNLLNTMPTEFHLIRVSERLHTLLFLVHHAAADGWTSAEFLKEWAAGYHEIITGRRPHWSPLARRASSQKAEREALRRNILKDLLFIGRLSARSRVNRQSFPDADPVGLSGVEHHIKTILSEEQTSHVMEIVEKERTAFVDLLVRAMNSALDQWNAARNIPPGVMTTGLTVQMRKRYGSAEAPMNSSAIYLTSHPEERRDSARFIRSLSSQRVNQFRTGVDVKIARAAYSLSDVLRILPLGARCKAAYSFVQRSPFCMQISYIGSGSPRFRRGRKTKEFQVTKPGGLDVTELHGIGCKLALDIPLRLWAGFYRNRLKLLLTAKGQHFNRAESESFLDLAAKILLENPFSPTASALT